MAKPITTSSAAQSIVPEWYANVAQDLLASQKAVLERQYTPYTGARIAGLTGDQLGGLEQARQSATGYQPVLNAALGRTLSANGDWDGALGALRAASVRPTQDWSAASKALDAATSGPGGLAAAQAMLNRSANPAGLAMAQPWLNAASGNVANVDEYMSPYQDDVITRIGELGARTLRDQLAPAINDKFISAGQLQSSGQSIDEARALRDVYSDTLGKQAEFLNQGYLQAQAAKAGDLSRYGTMAGTAGNLGMGQQNLLLDIGKSQGALAQGDTQNRLAAAQQQQALAQAQAQFKLQQQQQALAAAQQQAALAQAQSQFGLSQGQQLGALATQQQNQQIAGANTMLTAGGLQQGLNQKALDTAYQDFTNQQNFPQQQITNALQTFQGVQAGVPTGTVGYQQEVKGAKGPSAASTLLAGISAAKGVGVI